MKEVLISVDRKGDFIIMALIYTVQWETNAA